jgi:hypothetical protein
MRCQKGLELGLQEAVHSEDDSLLLWRALRRPELGSRSCRIRLVDTNLSHDTNLLLLESDLIRSYPTAECITTDAMCSEQ